MLSGITKAKGTFCCFLAMMSATASIENRSTAESVSAVCSNTTLAPREIFAYGIDAGLNPDHELDTSGSYRVVRHPIYTSMLCALAGTVFLITPLPVLL